MHKTKQLDLHAGIVKLFIVVVLYKLKPSESVTLNSLRASMLRLRSGQADTRILLYDNTLGGQDAGVLPAYVQYKADIENGGLAKAYNYALELAHKDGFDWLLTLDQDSSLPIDFLCKVCDAVTFVAPIDIVAAIVPRISGDGQMISPGVPMKHWTVTKRFSDKFIGISSENLTLAVNTASTFRVSALRGVGGYDPKFWLDFSDVAIYQRLHMNNLRVFVAGNIHVEHELSVFDLANRTTPTRYENIRRAEEAFCDQYLGRMEGMVLLLRLLYRLVYTLWRSGASPPYFKVGLKFLCRRVFYSRKHRMEEWQQSAT